MSDREANPAGEPRRVQVLASTLVNQIAAGEVVERPASVVKELLENALDAGARTVTVEIAAGGTESIRVSDDGHGMRREDAVTALERHATSKLRSESDLASIRTLGFRGEALPSIASVSRFRLVTRAAGDDAATEITVDGGDAMSVGDAGAPLGTSVEARDLFFNVPARRKFLKSRAAESAHITDVCLRAVLPHPGVHLILVRDGKRVLDVARTTSVEARAKAAFPGETLTVVEGERDGVSVLALLGSPETARANMAALHLHVNGRPVRDRNFARAVAFAYGEALPPARYPAGAVYLSLPLDEVDVNVHPQKSEVRFQNAQRVFGAVTRVLAPRLELGAWPRGRREAAFWSDRRTPAALRSPATLDGTRDGAAYGSASRVADAGALTDSWGLGAGRVEGGPRRFFESLRLIGQAHGGYLVCEDASSVYLVDARAADRTVKLAGFQRELASGGVSRHELLFPTRVELNDTDVAAAHARESDLGALGFEGGFVGERTFAIRSVPKALTKRSPATAFTAVLRALCASSATPTPTPQAALSELAAHAALGEHDTLTHDDALALLRALDDAGATVEVGRGSTIAAKFELGPSSPAAAAIEAKQAQ